MYITLKQMAHNIALCGDCWYCWTIQVALLFGQLGGLALHLATHPVVTAGTVVTVAKVSQRKAYQNGEYHRRTKGDDCDAN